MARNSNKLYNYVVNTFGISKEMLMEFVENRLEQLVNKHVERKLDSRAIESMILNHVTKVVTEGVPKPGPFGMSVSREVFDSYLRKVLKNVVEEKITKDFDVEVKVVGKDKYIVGRS